MAYVVKIESNRVIRCDIDGNNASQIAQDAVAADIGPEDQVVITTTDGRVIRCDINGNNASQIGQNATNARWVGSEIAVTKEDGTYICDSNGNNGRKI
jgi:hypothetical protein